MKIESPAFKQKEFIPQKYANEGSDVSPPLIIHDAPKETKSFALIVDDPDAPMGTFVHWVAWNIPRETTQLPEGVVLKEQGENHYHENRYRGPNPPPGSPHRYFFKLYALDTLLKLHPGALKEDLEKVMAGHILAKAELIGLYQR